MPSYPAASTGWSRTDGGDREQLPAEDGGVGGGGRERQEGGGVHQEAGERDAGGRRRADTGQAARDLGQEGRVPAGGHRVRRRPGERLEVPVHLLPERGRWVGPAFNESWPTRDVLILAVLWYLPFCKKVQKYRFANRILRQHLHFQNGDKMTKKYCQKLLATEVLSLMCSWCSSQKWRVWPATDKSATSHRFFFKGPPFWNYARCVVN